ncbi:MAG TPA: YihY/virulence factor BrkB family protein [Kofleriaceae bacterium]
MLRFLRRLGLAVTRDAIDDVGAMMAYYAILALFPMLLFVVMLAMLVLPPETIAEGARFAMQAAPSGTRSLITAQVDALAEHAAAGFALGTVAFALWGASRGASGLMLALNHLFKRTETRSWLRRQGIAITLTVGLAVLVVIALGLLVAGPLLGNVVADRLGLGSAFDLAWSIGRWLGVGLLMMTVWALAFRYLPDTDAPLRIFTPGALVGAALFLGISRLFELYLEYVASYASIYGALGSAVIFLTWLWLSALAMLFAAEINEVLAELRSERALRREPELVDMSNASPQTSSMGGS